MLRGTLSQEPLIVVEPGGTLRLTTVTLDMAGEGILLDQDGEKLLSMLPLTITVHWYRPDGLPVSQVIWKGNTSNSIHFVVESLPDQAQVHGAQSEDGKTWHTWSNFDVTTNDAGEIFCNFYQVDSSPMYYRLAASSWLEPNFWSSKAYLLPQEQGEDTGGNRGGSTTPQAPQREPAIPSPSPTPSPSTSWEQWHSQGLSPQATPEPTQSFPPAETTVPPPTPTIFPSPDVTASPRQGTSPCFCNARWVCCCSWESL